MGDTDSDGAGGAAFVTDRHLPCRICPTASALNAQAVGGLDGRHPIGRLRRIRRFGHRAGSRQNSNFCQDPFGIRAVAFTLYATDGLQRVGGGASFWR